MNTQLSANIKAFRKKLNFTEEEIANELRNPKREQVSYYENGNRVIPIRRYI